MSKPALLLVVIAGAVLLLLAAVAMWPWVTIPPKPEQDVDPTAAPSPAAEAHQGFLYGRITTADGATYEGRLRWGGRRGGVLGRLLQRLRPVGPGGVRRPPPRRSAGARSGNRDLMLTSWPVV